MHNRIVIVGAAACSAIMGCRSSTEPSVPVTVAIHSCDNTSENPIWMAVQDGDGRWARVEKTGESYVFTIRSGRAGVARVFDVASSSGATTSLQVTYASAAELAAVLPGCSASGPPTTTRAFPASAAGIVAPDEARVYLGSRSTRVTAASASAFVLTDDDRGAVDLVAVLTSAVPPPAFGRYATSVIVRRGLELATGATIPMLDFAGSDAIALAPRSITIRNVDGDRRLTATTTLHTPAAAISLAMFQTGSGGAGTMFPAGVPVSVTHSALPGSQLGPGELQETIVQSSGDAGITEHVRRLTLRGADVANDDMTLGPRIVMDLFTLKGSEGVVRVEADYRIQPGYNGHWVLSTSQAGRRVKVSMSRAYVGSASRVSVIAPDLGGTAGFLPAWHLKTWEITSWSFEASDENFASAIRQTRESSFRSAFWGANSSFVP